MSAFCPPWADLPPELLHDISGRLRNPSDFVRFHAVCTPWHDVALLHSQLTRPMLQPWLLKPSDGIILHSVVNFGPGSASDLRRDCDDMVLTEPAGASSGSHRNWVASTDGTAAWLFTWSTKPRLVNILTGDITLMPDKIKQHWKDALGNPRGIVYGDRTVLLYSCFQRLHTLILTATIMRPRGASWRTVQKKLDMPRSRLFDVAYQDSKLYLCSRDKLEPRRNTTKKRDYVSGGCYILKSNGELICAFVLHEHGWKVSDDPPPGALLVEVEVLEGLHEDGTVMWVKKEGRSLSDHVLFLGSPSSFSVDATELAMVGGCAYFVFGTCVFRCNLIDGEIKLVERLRHGCGVDGVNLWLRPQPTIAPIQEIRERLEALNKDPFIWGTSARKGGNYERFG